MLSKFSVKKPIMIIVLVIILIAIGVVSYLNTEVDLLPEMDLPYIVIATIFPGAAPDVVESDLTIPMETGLARVSGVKSMTTYSMEHVSLIMLELNSGADTTAVQLEIDRTLKTISYPDNDLLQDPIMLKVDPSLLPIMSISIGKSDDTVKDSVAYLSNIIEQLSAVDGVASVTTSGLVSNLALLVLNTSKMTEDVMNQILDSFEITLTLTDAQKDAMRTGLKSLIDRGESDPDIAPDGVIVPGKLLDKFVDELGKVSSGDDVADFVLGLLIGQLAPPESGNEEDGTAARKAAIEMIEVVLDGQYILEDNNKQIFNDILDDFYGKALIYMLEGYVGSMSGMLSGSILSQLIYAQDFDMPAGSLSEGATSVIVKIGDAITDREGLLTSPVYTMFLDDVLAEYTSRLDTFLLLLKLLNGNSDTFTFTREQLETAAETLSWALDFGAVDDYATWVVDDLAGDSDSSYYMIPSARTAWADLIRGHADYDALIDGWDTDRPSDWRRQLYTFVLNNNITPADGTLLRNSRAWENSDGVNYDSYYIEQLDYFFYQQNELRWDVYLKDSYLFSSEEAYYKYYAELAIDSIYTSTRQTVAPLGDSYNTWITALASDADFRAFLDLMDAKGDEMLFDYIYAAYDIMVANSIYPANDNPIIVGLYQNYVQTALNEKVAARVGDSSGAYVTHAVSLLLQDEDPDSLYYLPSDFVTTWENEINNASFQTAYADFKTTYGKYFDCDYAALSLMFATVDLDGDGVIDLVDTDSDGELDARVKLRADGTTIVLPEVIWDSAASVEYGAVLAGNISRETMILQLLDQIKSEVGEENYNMILEMFGGRTKEQNIAMFDAIIGLLEKYGGEGAMVVTGEDADREYTINIAVLRETIATFTTGAKVTLTLGGLADVYFLDDSTRQITTLLTRGADGNMVRSSSVQLSIDKESGASSATVSAAVKKYLESVAAKDSTFNFTILTDDGESIEFMLDTVVSNLLYGALLSIIILIIFLRSFKATFAVGLSIVISVLFAFVLMYFAGVTMNIVSMGGLALGVGMLVDNSIVVLENIYRMKAQGKNTFQAAIHGAKQVSAAIFASTLTTVVVFVPVIFIEGIVKQIFTDLALTICFSLLASLISALTIIPLSATTFLKEGAKPETKVEKRIKKAYVKALNFSLNNKWVVFLTVIVLLAGSVGAALSLGTEFFPDSYMGGISVSVRIDGDALNEKNKGISAADESYYTEDMIMSDAIEQMTEVFKNYPDIASVGMSTASGLTVAGMNLSSLGLGGGGLSASIKLVDESKRKYDPHDFVDALQKDLNEVDTDGLYTMRVSMTTMASMMDTSTGGAYDVYVYGDDYEEMLLEANRLAGIFEGVDDVTSVTGLSSTATEYKMVVDKDKANEYGLTVAQIYLQVAAAMTSPSSIHTLKIYSSESATRKDNVEVYVYTPTYSHTSWYNADDGTKVYFANNTSDESDSGAEYYVKNTADRTLYVKNGASTDALWTAVVPGGNIPVFKNGDTFSYTYSLATPYEVTSDDPDDPQKTVLHNVEEKTTSFKVSDWGKYYSTAKDLADGDVMSELLTMQISSEDMMGTGAEVTTVPLYQLLTDDSFSVDQFGSIEMKNYKGTTIPYSLKKQPGYSSIIRVDRQKLITLTVNYDSDAVSESNMVKRLNEAIGTFNVAKPDSVSATTDGGESIMEEVFNTLYLVLIFAIALIYLVMVAQFQSWKSPFIIMFTIPLAFTGSFFLLFVTGMKLSVMALMGLIILMGVVVNNGIVFVDYANRLIEEGVDRRTALFRTGIDRMRPVFMTALTTVFAMIIMAADGSDYGQMLQPLAITSIGGLLYATLMTLFVIPVVYDIFNKKKKPGERVRAMKDKNIDQVDMDDVFDTLDDEKAELIAGTIRGKQFRIIKPRGDGKKLDGDIWGAEGGAMDTADNAAENTEVTQESTSADGVETLWDAENSASDSIVDVENIASDVETPDAEKSDTDGE